MPIGIQTFSDIREGGYYYVDKTPFIEQLAHQNKYYFLARAAFKSLLLDNWGCLFEGRDYLFEGLYIHDKWDWQQQYPLVRLSFGSGVANSREDFDANIRYQLQQQRKKLNIETPLFRLRHSC